MAFWRWFSFSQGGICDRSLEGINHDGLNSILETWPIGDEFQEGIIAAIPL